MPKFDRHELARILAGEPKIITRRSRAFRARWVEPSIAALRRWVDAAQGTPSEVYALQALASRLESRR